MLLTADFVRLTNYDIIIIIIIIIIMEYAKSGMCDWIGHF